MRLRHLALSLLISVFGVVAFGSSPLLLGEGTSLAMLVAPLTPGRGDSVDYQSRLLLTPASVMKTVTSAAVLHARGGDYRWVTTVTAQGEIIDGVLHGNMVITGSGDPTLDSRAFSQQQPNFVSEVTQAAEALGIRSVRGRVIAAPAWPNQGAVPTWELEDISCTDGAGFYRLNWRDNVCSVEVPSLRVSPAGAAVAHWSHTAGPLQFSRTEGSDTLSIIGSHNSAKPTYFSCSMPNPPAALVGALSRALHAQGETVVPKSGVATTLLTHQSPPLREVVRSLMVRSDNQMAEAILRLLAPGGTRAQAIQEERRILRSLGVDLTGVRIADGSGLSRHNAISPRLLVDVLRAMADNPDFVGAFARVGREGTVRSFMWGNPNREEFILKSGSMTGIVCYCGYRLDPTTQRPTQVLALMTNNSPLPPATLRLRLSPLLIPLPL